MRLDCTFWTDVLANLLADIIAGAFLGTVLALWIGRLLNASERIEQRRAEINKAIRYLTLLRMEIEPLVTHLPELIGEIKPRTAGVEFMLTTPLWDVLQPSGELPKLLDADLLLSISAFYAPLDYAKRLRRSVIDSWLATGHRTADVEKTLTDATLDGLKKALEHGTNLPSEIDQGIEVLQAKLARLQRKRPRLCRWSPCPRAPFRAGRTPD